MISSHTTKGARQKREIPSSIRDKALQSFQKLRKMQEASFDGYVKCISCGKVMHWKEAEGGHYIPRTERATELEPDNVWPQCHFCNSILHGNSLKYRINLVRKIGEDRVRRIENMALAHEGDEDAMESLSMDDKIKVIQKRSKKYYLSRKKEFDDEIRKI